MGRSISDASVKKTKKPSIFNIFGSKKADQIEDEQKNQWNKVARSKSDVGSVASIKAANTERRRNNNEHEEPICTNKKKPVPLSPIIENPPREKYFTSGNNNLTGSKIAQPQFLSSGNIGFTNQKDLDLIPSKPINDSRKDTMNLITLPPNTVASEEIHSSQLPAQKLPLTKGVTVDGIVKRLSMESFSPLPHLNGPAFSYTRPNDNKIIYAQVVYDNDGKSKQTIHSSYASNSSKQQSVDRSQLKSSQRIKDGSFNDVVDSPNRQYLDSKNATSHSFNNVLYKDIEKHERSLSPVRHLQPRRTNSDEDEGLGFDAKPSEFEEPPIIPHIRDVSSPVRIKLDASYRGNADGIEDRHEPFPEFNELSNRRKQLESRMFSRRIGSAEHIPNKDRKKSREYLPVEVNIVRQNRSKSSELLRSPDRELHKLPLPKFESSKKYSPEPTEIIADYNKHNKYYNDQHETFRHNASVEREITPKCREYRTRTRIESPVKHSREIDLGYIEDGHLEYNNDDYRQQLELDTSYFQEKYRQEFEPKSLDSQFSEVNRSLSEPREVYREYHHHHQYRTEFPPEKLTYKPDNNFNSLNRAKKQNQQHSYDKGDSGIEHDYRKDSFNENTATR